MSSRNGRNIPSAPAKIWIVRVCFICLLVMSIAVVIASVILGFDKFDPVASVLALLSAVALALLQHAEKYVVLPTTAGPATGMELQAVRRSIHDLRIREADDHGLSTGDLLPVTIAGLDLNAATLRPASEDAPQDAVLIVPQTAKQVTPLWSMPTYTQTLAQHVMTRITRPADVAGQTSVRLVIHGVGGVGKSTLALLLTIGLTEWNAPTVGSLCMDETTPAPLLISVSGYDGRGRFIRWLNRKAARLYAPLDGIQPGPDDLGAVDRLLSWGQAILILDSWDEMPIAARAKAANELKELMSSAWSFIILSRADNADRVRDRIGALDTDGVAIVAVEAAPLYIRQAYLRHRAAMKPRGDANWEPGLVQQLANDLPVLSALEQVLSTPMMLELAARAVGRGAEPIGELSRLATTPELGAVRSRLLRAHVSWAVSPSRKGIVRMLTHRRALLWMTNLAHVMIETKTHQLSWWRTIGRVTHRVLAVAASLTVLPGYWLAIQMPVGLTRGLAVGSAVGVGAAVMRSRPIAWQIAAPIFAILFACVASVGTIKFGWKQGFADGLEIAGGVTVAYLFLDTLVKSRWPRRLTPRWLRPPIPVPAGIDTRPNGVIAAGRWTRARAGRLAALIEKLPPGAAKRIMAAARFAARQGGTFGPPLLAILAAGAVGTMLPVLFKAAVNYSDPERQEPLMITVAVTFGVALATVAARTYITKEETVPSVPRLRPEYPRTEPWTHAVAVATLFATTVGIGGAIGGGLRYGLEYAAAVAVVFLFIAGVPVGIVGGTVKWLCSPLRHPDNSNHASTATSSTWRTDTTVNSESIVETEEFDRSETAVTMRGDRWLALTIIAAIGALSAAALSVLRRTVPHQLDVINVHAEHYAIGPEDAALVALTLGLIVACTYTVWPVFLVAHLWRVLHGDLPWRLKIFAEEMQESRLVVRDGDTWKWRYAGLRSYLGEQLYYDLRPHLTRPQPTAGAGAEPVAVSTPAQGDPP